MAYIARLFNGNADKEGLMSLWFEELNKPTLERYENMYDRNIYCKILTCLLFNEKISQPVGCMSLYPGWFNISGQRILMAVNFDMIVNKQHRTLGPAIILLKTLIKESEKFNYKALIAIPNEMSKPIFIKAGYKKIGHICGWSKILNSDGKLLKIIKNKYLRKIVSFILNFLLKYVSFDILILLLHRRFPGTLSEKNINFNQIRTNKNAVEKDTLEKTSEYMEWRYSKVDCNNSQIFCLYKNDTLFGYIIYFIDEKEVIIEDIYINKVNYNLLILLAIFVNKMRNIKMDLITIPYSYNGPMQKYFKILFFFRKGSRDMFLKIIDQSLEKIFSNKISWSLFDSDLDL